MSDTEFKFLREDKLRSRRAIVFGFHVEKQENHLYHLHARYLDGREAIDFPGYRGEICSTNQVSSFCVW